MHSIESVPKAKESLGETFFTSFQEHRPCPSNESLGTSGSGTQSFRHHGKKQGHILDPRTGHPAEGVLSATVVAQDAATADALATACYVLGKEGAITLCQQQKDFSLLIVTPGKRTGDIEVITEGFGAEVLTLVEG